MWQCNVSRYVYVMRKCDCGWIWLGRSERKMAERVLCGWESVLLSFMKVDDMIWWIGWMFEVKKSFEVVWIFCTSQGNDWTTTIKRRGASCDGTSVCNAQNTSTPKTHRSCPVRLPSKWTGTSDVIFWVEVFCALQRWEWMRVYDMYSNWCKQ